MKTSIAALRELVEHVLDRYGYPAEEIQLVADVLLYAQLRGNNQGIAKLVPPGMPRDPSAGGIETVIETPLSARLNGGRNPGIVVMMRAVELAKGKAAESGVGIVGTFNTSSSTGAIGYYARQIASSDLIGVVASGSPPSVAPHGSFEPIFGTNPLAVGLPSDSRPVVFDMATSAIPWYGLIEASAAKRQIPENLAFDVEGTPTTDPVRAMGGAIRPFDRSPKGSGLAMIVEALTGPLVGASFAQVGDADTNWGNLVLALDPGLLIARNEFLAGVTELVNEIKRAKRLPSVAEVFVPGERGDRRTSERLENHQIEIEENLLRELEQVAASG